MFAFFYEISARMPLGCAAVDMKAIHVERRRLYKFQSFFFPLLLLLPSIPLLMVMVLIARAHYLFNILVILGFVPFMGAFTQFAFEFIRYTLFVSWQLFSTELIHNPFKCETWLFFVSVSTEKLKYFSHIYTNFFVFVWSSIVFICIPIELSHISNWNNFMAVVFWWKERGIFFLNREHLIHYNVGLVSGNAILERMKWSFGDASD